MNQYAPMPLLPGCATAPIYPVDALPPIIRNAALEVEGIAKAPLDLVVASALCVVSLACQSQIRVRRFNGIVTPVSTNWLCVAESGERKTTVDNIFARPITDFQNHLNEILKPLKKVYRVEKIVWEAEKKGLLTAIKAATKKGECCTELKERLGELIERMPIEPATPKLIYRDVTTEALAEGLQNWSSAAIICAEAGAIFDGRTFGSPGFLNIIWDGGDWSVDRRCSESITIRGAQLSISLMVQPKTFKKFLEGKGRFARDNGFLARFQVGWPISTQGYRWESNLPQALTNNGLEIFTQRLREILFSSVGDDGRLIEGITILDFSEEGKQECIRFTNRVENELRVGGYFADIRDAASKLADNMSRLAALFHHVIGKTGPIERETVLQAIRICEWHIEQFKAIFGTKPEIPVEVLDSELLKKWLIQYFIKHGVFWVSKSEMERGAPGPIRPVERLSPAILVLMHQHAYSDPISPPVMMETVHL